jgi:ribose transport system substrate-binding protein
MTHDRSVWARAMGGTLATAALIAAMSGTALAQSPAASAEPAASPAPAASIPVPSAPFTIGYSNGGGVGNGFREEQVCTAKAEALALGSSIVNPLTNLIHRNTDAAGQLSDLRTLISQKVNAIVFNPNDPDALNPALAEAHAAGIPTVSVDAYVTDPNTWNLYNNQVKYAQIGAEWLFKQMGGTGTVWYTRGLAGHPADSDRDIGFNNALKEYPNIKVINPGGTFTGWDPATATQITNDFIASGNYDQIQGIWASGMGNWILPPIHDALAAGTIKNYVPIVDADIGGMVSKLLDSANYPGLVGAAVTNTASVGGAGVRLATELLSGITPQQSAGAGRPNTILLDPQILDNTTDAGKAALQAWVSVPGMDPTWPLSLSIPGWTDYDPNTVPATCKGA